MKLWILRPVKEESPPWEPWFDRAFGFVLCAIDEPTARSMAASDSGDEGPEAWTDPALSTCNELVAGEAGFIMRDFASA
jgi:hypothetical protein